MIALGGLFAVFKGLAAIKSLVLIGGLGIAAFTTVSSCKHHFRSIEENAANKIELSMALDANEAAAKNMEQFQAWSKVDKSLAIQYQSDAEGLQSLVSSQQTELGRLRGVGLDGDLILCPDDCLLPKWNGNGQSQEVDHGDNETP